MRIGWTPLVAALALLAGAAPAAAQAPPAVLLVMDASDSMAKDAGNGQTRLEVAKGALREAIRALPDGARVGLRLYGHRLANVSRAEGCRDTELVTPVGPADKAALERTATGYEAKGRTPIGRSLRAAADDLAAEKGRKIVVLVSDGGDNCAPPDPCRVAREISDGGVKLRIQPVGFQVSERARRQLECIADAGGGRYTDAQDPDKLGDELRTLLARAFRDYRARGKPIRGGATQAQAVPTDGGAWLDSLSGAGQQRWYRLTLKRGERLWATATIVRRNDVRGDAGADVTSSSRFDIALGPASNPEATTDAALFEGQRRHVGGRGDSLVARGGPVGEVEAFARPGTYFLRVGLDRIRNFETAVYPVELTIYKLRARPGRIPPEAATLAAPPRRAARRPARAEEDDDGGPSAALVGAGGGVLGLLIGAVAALRRRP